MPGKNSKSNPAEPGRVWTLDDIQELLDLLAGKEITEFEMEQQGVKIRVLRGGVQAANPGGFNGYVMTPAGSQVIAAPAPAVPSAPPAPAAPAAPAAAEPAADSTEGLFIMKSPIVGTFYESPSPGAPPFVKPGDQVEVGQVLCIIEAMKLMNEIEAEVSGVVAKMFVPNGSPVEYGMPLFGIRQQ